MNTYQHQPTMVFLLTFSSSDTLVEVKDEGRVGNHLVASIELVVAEIQNSKYHIL